MVVFSKSPVFKIPTSFYGDAVPADLAAVREVSRLMRFGNFIANNGAIADDVMLEVLSYLDLGELARLRLACKSLRRLVPMELNTRLNKLLVFYIANIDRAHAFRARMDATQSVIGGSEALRFVCPAAWTANNLDIFTAFEEAQGFVDLLVSWGGFVVPRNQVPHPNAHGYLERRNDTHSVTTVDLDGKLFNIIESKTGSAMHAVLDGWSTALINVVTSRFAVVSYPHLTFDSTGLYNGINHRGTRDVNDAVVAKYDARGYQHFDTTIYGDFGAVCMSNWWSIDRTDRLCVVPLDYADAGVAPEFGDDLRWRVGSVCRVVGCPHKHDDDTEAVSELEWLGSLRA